jgi:cation:H+ antiporter
MLTYILFVPGFVLLLGGGSFLVDGASAIARKLGVSDLAIALTVVAFGTSAPELIVSIFAAAKGNTEIAIGNAIGSNIMNIFVILGVAAVIYPLAVGRGTAWKEIPFSLLAVVIVGIMANDEVIDGVRPSALTRIDGLVLISFLIIFLAYVVSIAKRPGETPVPPPAKKMGAFRAWTMLILGIAALNVGAEWVVNGAVKLAESFGVSEAVIALTIVSVGTSLPELATSAVAAWKKNADMAVGNVVGSNIFNMFWILGVASTIRPLPFPPEANIDVAVAALASILLLLWVFVGFRRRCLERYEGAIFLILYAAYLVYLVKFRGVAFPAS